MKTSDDLAELKKLFEFVYRICHFCHTPIAEADFWQATTPKGTSTSIRPMFRCGCGPSRSTTTVCVHWFEAEVIKVTATKVMVRYAGETARLDRKRLWRWWVWWRGVQFVSSRSGRIAAELHEIWQRRYGAKGSVPPSLQMPLDQARALLGAPADYSRRRRHFRLPTRCQESSPGRWRDC
jgi:hypothetical protein